MVSTWSTHGPHMVSIWPGKGFVHAVKHVVELGTIFDVAVLLEGNVDGNLWNGQAEHIQVFDFGDEERQLGRVVDLYDGAAGQREGDRR